MMIKKYCVLLSSARHAVHWTAKQKINQKIALMKKMIAIIAGVLALNAHAQLTAEGIMALLPDMPSQAVMTAVATHSPEFNDQSAATLEWDNYFNKLQEVISQAEKAVERETTNATATPSRAAMQARAEAQAGITAEQVKNMTPEQLAAFAKAKAKANVGKGTNGLTTADLTAMANMSEADRVEYAMLNGLTLSPEQAKAMKAKAAKAHKAGQAAMNYQELVTKGLEMSQKAEKMLDEARTAIRDMWKNGYQSNYDAACKKEREVWAKYGEDPEGVTEYNAACLQIYKITSEFNEKSYTLWRNAVTNAMTYFKTDYLLYARQLMDAMEGAGNPMPNYDMEIAMQYLRQALALRDIPNPINE